MELEDKIRCNELLKEKHSNWLGLSNQKAIRSMLEELDRLQKENEELSCVKKAIKVYKTNVGTENCQFVLMSESEFLNSFNYKCLLDDYISKDKIKELIIKKKQQIQENNKQMDECRKTIMEEQELKKIQLYTLTKSNNLLELEIASLLDLLKEE